MAKALQRIPNSGSATSRSRASPELLNLSAEQRLSPGQRCYEGDILTLVSRGHYSFGATEYFFFNARNLCLQKSNHEITISRQKERKIIMAALNPIQNNSH